MAEDQKLTCRTRVTRPPGDPQLIAAMFLGDTLDAKSSLPPVRRDDPATMVRGSFFDAGRFGEYVFA
jgi:hypothetical protein